MKALKKIPLYFSTHLAASFILALALTFLAMMALMQDYLRRDYLQYMLDQSYQQEQAVMRSLQQNLNQTIENLIRQGSEIAVDRTLYNLAVSEETEDDAVREITRKLELSNQLRNYTYGSYAIVIAVEGPDGLLAQYDRFNATLQDTQQFWQGEKRDALKEMTAYLREEEGTKEDSFSRIRVCMEPGMHSQYQENRVFHMIFPLTGGTRSIWGIPYGLVMTYSMELFQGFLDTVELPQGDYIQGYIADRDGKILYSGDEDWIGQNAGELTAKTEMRLVSGELDHFGWTMNIIIDVHKLNTFTEKTYQKDFFLYALLLIVCIFIIGTVFSRLMRPVGELSASMQQAGSGLAPSPVPIRGKHEIWQVAREYNHMLEALDEKTREVERQHQMAIHSLQQKHDAEREALESQINAHFICNTLGCINYEAIEAGNQEVSVLIKKLSNILRYSFDQRHQEVLIFQEIAWVDQYLYLQKMRREDLFDYEIVFPEVYGQWPCCKLMFQPFVENSILHGFEGKKSGGRIRIVVDMEGELLRIVIEDNGRGMDAETELAIQEILRNKGAEQLIYSSQTGIGIGISNVVTRMRMFYGSRFDVRMETKQQEGTRFTFLIPIPETADDAASEEEV